MHADNRETDILVLGESSADKLDDATITVETKYSIYIIKSRNKVCLSLHYNGSNRFLYDNGVKIYQFKTKYSEIKPYSLCFGNTLKYFAVGYMKKQG